MPVFVLKAKDRLAADVIEEYARRCVDRGLNRQARHVRLAVDEMRAWQVRHPEAMKLPDHDHVPAGRPGSGSGSEPKYQ